MNTRYDDPHGDILARALRQEADTIVPAGDGLTRIRERVEGRRRSARWLLPAVSLGTAAVVGGVAVGAWSALSGNDKDLRVSPAHSGDTSSLSGSPAPSTHPTTPRTSPSASHPVPPPPAGTAQLASGSPVWPFSSGAEVAAWQADYAAGRVSPRWLDPTRVATAFVESLRLPAQQLVVSGSGGSGSSGGASTADVELSTTSTPNHQPAHFGTVHLVRWGSGSKAPWEVVGVSSPEITITSPATSTAVSSPLTVRYTLAGGAEEDVYTSAWDGTGRLASGHATVGGGDQQAALSFGTPATASGYVVVADVQGAAGPMVLERLAVVPVRFGASGTPVAAKYPPYFIAVKDGRLALFYSKLGGFGRWLTDQQPGGGPSSPQLSSDGQWVYFLRGEGSGQQDLRRVSVNGGAEQVVASPNGVVQAFAVGGARNQLLAYAVASGGAQQVVWRNTETGTAGGFHIDSRPPQLQQLAWAPDGDHLAATIRTGTLWHLSVFDTATATQLADESTVPCPRRGCAAPSYDAAGNLYFLEAVDSSHWQLVQWTGTKINGVAPVALPAQASPESATLDMTTDAYAAVVGTPDGHVFRVDNGQAHLLSTQATSPTW